MLRLVVDSVEVPVYDGLSWSNIDPGGFETLTAAVPELAGLRPNAPVVLLWEHECVFHGVINDPTTQSVEGNQLGQISAVGSGVRLKDNPYREVYIDRDLRKWVTWTPDARVLRLGALQILSDAPGVRHGGESAEYATALEPVWAAKTISEGFYDADSVTLGTLYYAVRKPSGSQVDTADTTLTIQCGLLKTIDDPDSNADTSGNVRASLPTSGYVSATADTSRTGAFVQQYDTGAGGIAGKDYDVYWTLAVYGDHGLTRRGSDPGGFYATDIARDALTRPQRTVVPQISNPSCDAGGVGSATGWTKDSGTAFQSQTVVYNTSPAAFWVSGEASGHSDATDGLQKLYEGNTYRLSVYAISDTSSRTMTIRVHEGAWTSNSANVLASQTVTLPLNVWPGSPNFAIDFTPDHDIDSYSISVTGNTTSGVSLFFDDVVLELVDTTPLAIGVVEGPMGDASSYVIQHAVYNDKATSPEEVIADMAVLMGWHWGVWEPEGLHADDAELWLVPRPADATATVDLRDCSEVTLPKVRRDLLYDEARVGYQDAAGTKHEVAVRLPNPLVAEAKIRHRPLQLDMGIADVTSAADFGGFALALAQDAARGGGQVTLPQYLPDGRPSCTLRAGRDRIRLIGLPDPGDITAADTRRYDTFFIRRVAATVTDGIPQTVVEFDGGADLLETLNRRSDLGAVLAGA